MVRYSIAFENKILQLYDSGNSASEVGIILNKQTTAIVRVLKRNNRRICTNKGSDHPMWKGGRGIKSGYWTVYNPTHHRALKIGRVYEHILIMEKHLGRIINKSEHIHHINFDRLDNRVENLWVTDNKGHHLAERSIYKLIKEMLDKGILRFNREKGRYELC